MSGAIPSSLPQTPRALPLTVSGSRQATKIALTIFGKRWLQGKDREQALKFSLDPIAPSKCPFHVSTLSTRC